MQNRSSSPCQRLNIPITTCVRRSVSFSPPLFILFLRAHEKTHNVCPTVITNPMDLQTMLKRVKQRMYKSKREFQDDLDLIWNNCYTYNTGDVRFRFAAPSSNTYRRSGRSTEPPDAHGSRQTQGQSRRPPPQRHGPQGTARSPSKLSRQPRNNHDTRRRRLARFPARQTSQRIQRSRLLFPSIQHQIVVPVRKITPSDSSSNHRRHGDQTIGGQETGRCSGTTDGSVSRTTRPRSYGQGYGCVF